MTYGKDFAQEALLNRFDDFIQYLNRITKGPVRKYLGILEFDKQIFRDVYKYEFTTYSSK